ncbi:MAG: hypothetical protein JNM18_13325 [Planctomycetaceae bacterium]|nr:hypothetical protein [Planctomycetaceae bacterium]
METTTSCRPTLVAINGCGGELRISPDPKTTKAAHRPVGARVAARNSGFDWWNARRRFVVEHWPLVAISSSGVAL